MIMPSRIPKACRKQGCAKTTTDKTGYCVSHKPLISNWGQYTKGKTRSQRGYGSSWDKLREKVLKRDKYICQCIECKSSGLVKPATEVDHIKPKAHGGDDSM